MSVRSDVIRSADNLLVMVCKGGSIRFTAPDMFLSAVILSA